MNNPDQMLHKVSLLLAALPGVGVIGRRFAGGQAYFEITVAGASAAYRLQKLCRTVHVTIEPPMHLQEAPFSEERTYRLSVGAYADEESAGYGLVQLGLFGSQLISDLRRNGSMSETEAQEFQR
jgi:hypothetical protein